MMRRLTTCLLLATTPVASAGTVSCVWITGGPGSTGSWMESSNWRPSIVPGHTCCFINYYASIGLPTTVELPTNTTINALDIGFASTLRVNNGVYLDLREGLSNDGLIQINGTTSVTTLIASSVGSDFYIAGSGVIEFGGHPNSRFDDIGVPLIINGPNHTLAGAGALIRNGTAFRNEGIVVGSKSGELLTVDPASAGAVNTGQFKAINGGILVLFGGNFDNTQGLVIAQAGSTVRLNTGLIIDGGTYQTEEDGEVRITANVTVRNPLNQGVLVVEDTRSPIFTGIWTNHGDIYVDGQTALTNVRLGSAGVILQGTGTLTLGDSVHSQVSATTSALLTHEASHVIQGGGNLGGGLLWIVNLGTILGDSNVPLTIAPRSSGGLMNSGLIHAQGFGGIVLHQNGHTNQETGDIFVQSKLTISNNTTLVNNGRLVLAEPTATIVSQGQLNQTSTGSMTFTLGDGAYSQIYGISTMSLDGELIVVLEQGFVPAAGSYFDIIDDPTVSGTFATVTGPPGMEVMYHPNQVSLYFACPGDLGGDDTVNVIDLLALIAAWGPNPGHPADLNGDGTVNLTDLLALIAAWGPCR